MAEKSAQFVIRGRHEKERLGELHRRADRLVSRCQDTWTAIFLPTHISSHPHACPIPFWWSEGRNNSEPVISAPVICLWLRWLECKSPVVRRIRFEGRSSSPWFSTQDSRATSSRPRSTICSSTGRATMSGSSSRRARASPKVGETRHWLPPTRTTAGT
jgi:hypothetical protein